MAEKALKKDFFCCGEAKAEVDPRQKKGMLSKKDGANCLRRQRIWKNYQTSFSASYIAG